jgi:ribosomal-protein-alanine N-acetyltransferase
MPETFEERVKAWKPGQAVVLDAPRTIIRSMTAEDVTERYVSWFADPEIMQHVTMGMNLSRAELIAFVASFDNAERFHFGVFLKDTGLHIGWLKLLCDPVNRNGILTTVIGDPTYWSLGFGFEMRTAIIDFMFDVLDLHKAVSMVYSDNQRTHALNIKLGFRREGILREEEVGRGGEWRDVHVFGLLAEEWRRRSAPA